MIRLLLWAGFASILWVWSPDGRAGPSLDQKLQAQFDRYDQATKKLVENAKKSAAPLSRSEWEASLALDQANGLTPGDRDSLVKRQNAEIEKAKLKAVSESKINLETFRKKTAEVARFCKEMPKGAMLHVHPNGSFKRSTIGELLKQSDPVIDENFYERAKQTGAKNTSFLEKLGPRHFGELTSNQQSKVVELFCVPDSETITFQQFDSFFPLLKNLSYHVPAGLDPELLAYEQFLKNAHDEGVNYVEFTKGLSISDAELARVDELSKKLYEKTGVHLGWNVAFNRQGDQGWMEANSEAMLQSIPTHPGTTIVGVDVFGREDRERTYEAAARLYPKLMAHGDVRIGRTIHSGEMGDPRNPRDAILIGAERIGHGVLLQEDPVTLEYARKRRIGIETNLTSNLKLGVVPSIREHPFLRFLRLGLKVSLSTDDEGIFDTDIAKECSAAVTNTDITYRELQQIAENSIETSFAPPQLKEELLRQLRDSFAKFESKWEAHGVR